MEIDNKIETAQSGKDCPKKPESCGNMHYFCPTCKITLPLASVFRRARWCSVCGQILDWEDVL